MPATCPATEHNFLPAGSPPGGYFKRKADGLPDQEVSYQMLYCTKCGVEREVVVQDHRRKP